MTEKVSYPPEETIRSITKLLDQSRQVVIDSLRNNLQARKKAFEIQASTKDFLRDPEMREHRDTLNRLVENNLSLGVLLEDSLDEVNMTVEMCNSIASVLPKELQPLYKMDLVIMIEQIRQDIDDAN